jgi:hypothetical protein
MSGTVGPPVAIFISIMFGGNQMFPGSRLVSPDFRFTLTLQSDGNLVLYDPNNVPLFASNTQGITPQALIMQNDGNLVLYDTNGMPQFASNTSGNPGAYLALQTDGNLVVYIEGKPLFASNTAGVS